MRAQFNLGLYVLASIIFFADLVDLLIRLYFRRQNTVSSSRELSSATSVSIDVGTFTPYQMRLHLRPFALVVSVHNAAGYIKAFIDSLGELREHLWVIDDASTDETPAVLASAGVRFVQNPVNGRKPAALRTLMPSIPRLVETILVLDPDVRILTPSDDIVRVLFEFQRSGMAALCPRVNASGTSWLARIQRLEYCLAFSIGRKSLSDFSITSGVAVYRADALRYVLDRHSLSVYAEDLENALILLAERESIYYDGRLVLETDAVESLRHLFAQRVGWHFGLMRVYLSRWRTLWRRAALQAGFAYQFIIYLGVLTLLLHPLKILAVALLAASAAADLAWLCRITIPVAEAFVNPWYFPVVYIQYVALVLFAVVVSVSRRERLGLLAAVPLYPIYVILHVIPATIGYLNWVSLRLWGRRVYRDHYAPALP